MVPLPGQHRVLRAQLLQRLLLLLLLPQLLRLRLMLQLMVGEDRGVMPATPSLCDLLDETNSRKLTDQSW